MEIALGLVSLVTGIVTLRVNIRKGRTIGECLFWLAGFSLPFYFLVVKPLIGG